MNPQSILREYLNTRRDELSNATLRAHEYRLTHFVRWCEAYGIEDLGDLDQHDLAEFREWRRQDGNLNRVSLHTQLSTLRVFLQYCEASDIVEDGLFEKLDIPTLRPEEEARRSLISAERMDRILEYLEEFEYASPDHALMLLLWETGMRVGAVRSIDIDDFDFRQELVEVLHRPQGGTSLKLGKNGERILPISSDACSVIQDYIVHRRTPITDAHGREPLLVFGGDRPATSTLRQHVHRNTQPCLYKNQCPHDCSIATCEAKGLGTPNSCPSSRPPHDIRRGAITNWLSQDVPRQIVTERMNVNDDALDTHYDMRDELVTTEQQRRYLDKV